MNEQELLQNFLNIIHPLTITKKINWIRCTDGGYQMEYTDSFRKTTTSCYIIKKYKTYYLTFHSQENVKIITSKDPTCKAIYQIAKENGDATLEYLDEFVKTISTTTTTFSKAPTYILYVTLTIEFIVLSILMFMIEYVWNK
jgi:hypothetical protein